jgi:hypothetical protein
MDDKGTNGLYVLAPGYVSSYSDNDIHYISAKELRRLYGLRANQCIEACDGNKDEYGCIIPPGIKRLYPRHDGEYVLPKG